ncbi:enoyl-CoA hydratase/isomerase family protein [Rhodopila sp.]|uniref:enoyl-CoA hydratase/isomerase family protein n=1 Tax=Rhodopila sp. TaxID=2480087 RepID=UPI002C28C12D|nr:enoyl-CoA hydratase/isomerase family protein [Rhodopila sp.]HVZ10414.1 enoyl-CoA hydratase/isomerase family protein [Rhodopila sp.]
MTAEPTVIARRDGRVGRILLNRPRALNALNLDMIRACDVILRQWRDDPHVHAVIIEGAGERAFCAGGDIIELREAQISGNRPVADAFFQEEYALNLLIATYPKPYIALIDGICMGGGIGMSVHGAYRVATEHASFGMPETAIGFFPDIGATFLLPRLRGHLGLYLGLTGLRLSGADAVHAGLATHFVPHAKLVTLSAALAQDGPSVLAEHSEALPPFSLAPHLAAIEHCFTADTVPGIVARLEQQEDDWAKRALKALRTVSPSALFWTLQALRNGADLTLPAALDAEFQLTRTTMAHPDFTEGVRAMVVDKDRKPAWKPARIEDVDPASIAGLFTG